MSANASRSRIQGLIMEVLNAHPSARDSKAYLQSFGIAMPTPGPSSPTATATATAATSSNPPSPIPIGANTNPAFHFTQHTALVKVQGPFSDRQLSSIADGLVYLKRLGLMSILVLDSERWPTAAARFNQHGQLLVPRALLDPETDPRRVHPHAQSGAIAAAAALSSVTRTPAALVGKTQEGLRKRMVHQVLRLSSLLEARGAPSLPLTQPLFRIDRDAVAELHGRVPAPAPARPGHIAASAAASSSSSSSSSASSSGSPNSPFAPSPPRPYAQQRSPFPTSSRKPDELSIYHSPLSNRAPLVSSDGLAAIRAALLSDQLPVLAPIALYEDPHDGGAERALAVTADDTLVGLAREMSDAAIQAAKRRQRVYLSGAPSGDNKAAAAEDAGKEDAAPAAAVTEQDDLDLMPLRLMVINREGGIPSHARGGNPHLSINLASEYSQIHRTFIWNRSHASALRNLRTVKDCLAYMPHPTSSGVVVSHRSPKSLIANLITNKAAHSPSLPHSLLEGRNDVRHTPTIVRWGLPVRVLERIEEVELDKLGDLLEVSFGRTLDRENYFERLRRRLDFVIVAGDYQGAAIVTKEWAPGEEELANAQQTQAQAQDASTSAAQATTPLMAVDELDARAAETLVNNTAAAANVSLDADDDGGEPQQQQQQERQQQQQQQLQQPLEPIAYLDKFAVLPSLRGSGVVDFLWGALRDEVHGLGLLDALNENGGKGGFGAGRDLVWKSRGENTVNRWYFERSNGFVRIPGGGGTTTTPGTKQGEREGEEDDDQARLPWVMFWCDAEERLANMSGEKRLGAEATYEDVLDMAVERERRRVEEEEEEEEEVYGGGMDGRSPPSSSSSSSSLSRLGGRAVAGRNGGEAESAAEDELLDLRLARAGAGAGPASRAVGRNASPMDSPLSGTSPMLSSASLGSSSRLSVSRSSSSSMISSSSASSTAPSSSSVLHSAGGSGGSSGNLFTRLPHIAPEERGRLERWARCMASIPSAWL
ncbi:Amino-acid acetyltransferase, mitochondrial [Tilletia horrida]|nr:Amino-acid acetyltransferase, mitochondrial [Tilletia horrida]